MGLLERMDESLELYFDVLQRLDLVVDKRQHVDPATQTKHNVADAERRVPELSPETRAKVEAYCALDLELVAHARELFEAELREMRQRRAHEDL